MLILFTKGIVFRFMPDGMYLNARQFGTKKLAKTMSEIMVDQEKYYNFFKWHNYYNFQNRDEISQHHGICELCALLNNRMRRDLRTVYRIITKFWNVQSPDYSNNFSSESMYTSATQEIYQNQEQISDNNGVLGWLMKLFFYFF